MPSDRERVVRIGCSGWNYADWKEPFYGGRPASEWLELYTQHFDTVEINNTFYRLPKTQSVAAWERTAPNGFCFAVKVSRYITHIKRLRDLGEPVARFRACIEPLRKLGPFLWQLPPNFPRDDERLRATLESLPAGERHAFEFRHESWFDDEVYAQLRAHGAALVLTGEREVFTAPWTYVRFHHGTRGRRGNYSESELREWAARIRAWDVGVYAYFNNDWEAFAPRNAMRLKELLYA
ncbi:MAG TPA: DUF72 domain-containing protein [Gaiellaceae bacterium]